MVIATPGRLLDLVNRSKFNLSQFNTLVLDEFDRMLDMGFVNDVKRILNGMHKRKHTLLFSATVLRWITDSSENFERTRDFIARYLKRADRLM